MWPHHYALIHIYVVTILLARRERLGAWPLYKGVLRDKRPPSHCRRVHLDVAPTSIQSLHPCPPPLIIISTWRFPSCPPWQPSIFPSCPSRGFTYIHPILSSASTYGLLSSQLMSLPRAYLAQMSAQKFHARPPKRCILVHHISRADVQRPCRSRTLPARSPKRFVTPGRGRSTQPAAPRLRRDVTTATNGGG
jgi:hypothetical protein